MSSPPLPQPLSVRAHFWLRMAGLVAMLAAQFGPRIWSGFSTQPTATASVASASHLR